MGFARFFRGLSDVVTEEGSAWKLKHGDVAIRVRVGASDRHKVLLAVAREDEWRLSDKVCAAGTGLAGEMQSDEGVLSFGVQAISRGADEKRSLYVTRPTDIQVKQRRGGDRSTVLLNAWVRCPDDAPPGDEALVRDISRGGAKLLVHDLKCTVSVGSRMKLILEGPGVGKAEVTAEVRRLVKRMNGVDMGLALLPEDNTELEAISALVARVNEAKERQSG